MLAWSLVVGGLALLVYVLAAFPVLLALRARLRPWPVGADPGHRPSVSLLISAFNEERDLPRKLDSLLALDYPADRLEILVADDGSVDGTSAVVRERQPQFGGRLRLLDATENLGKPAQLNRLAAAASGDVLVYSDARQPLERDAVSRLVAVFADPRVGGASGAVDYRTPQGDRVPIGPYWAYESALREWEGQVHSCPSAAGPLLAVRREAFRPLPENTVLDDMLIPLRVALGGSRFVYVPDAVAVETYAMGRRHEFQRRVRTLAGNYQLLRFEPTLLLPWRNPIWGVFVSHKVGRLLVPWCLLAILAGTLLGLGHHLFFGWLLAVQLVAYLWALVGYLGAGRPWVPKTASAAYFLVMLAAAALAGLWRDARGASSARWGRTETSRREG